MSEELLNTTVEQEYDASQIQVLEGLEAVRKRPGMYIGSTSASGLHHLVYEIVDNAIDEALAGYCTHITVTINPGDTITVTDNGRGIPVDIQAQTGRPALEVVYTVLHAGGKFGGGGYKVSGGLHGVGASVVNALSEWLMVEVHKEGKIYQMKFARGNITQEMRIIGDTDRHGTIVTFKPDPEMFDTLTYDYRLRRAFSGCRRAGPRQGPCREGHQPAGSLFLEPSAAEAAGERHSLPHSSGLSHSHREGRTGTAPLRRAAGRRGLSDHGRMILRSAPTSLSGRFLWEKACNMGTIRV